MSAYLGFTARPIGFTDDATSLRALALDQVAPGQPVQLLAAGGLQFWIVRWDPAETAPDDGSRYFTPDSITEPAPGRWVAEASTSALPSTLVIRDSSGAIGSVGLDAKYILWGAPPAELSQAVDATSLGGSIAFKGNDCPPLTFERASPAASADVEIARFDRTVSDGAGGAGEAGHVAIGLEYGGSKVDAATLTSTLTADLGGGTTFSLATRKSGTLAPSLTIANSGAVALKSVDALSATSFAVGGSTATRVDLSKSGGGVRFPSLAVAGLLHLDASGDASTSLLVDADVGASAAVAGTKISPDFGSQAVTTTGTITGGNLKTDGVVGRSTSGALTLGDGSTDSELVVDAASPALTVKKAGTTNWTLKPSGGYLELTNANQAGVNFGLNFVASFGDAQLVSNGGGVVLNGAGTVILCYAGGGLRQTIAASAVTLTVGLLAPSLDTASAAALTLAGTNATSIACSGKALTGVLSVDNSGAGLTLGANTTSQTAGKSGTTWTQSGALSVAEGASGTRFVGGVASPTSASNLVTFTLATKQHVHHLTTEASTVTFVAGADGQDGYIEVEQGNTGYAITLPAASSTLNYDDAVIALGLGSIIDAGSKKRTTLRYHVTGTVLCIESRSVISIP